jgi:hypothetical protein
MIVAFPKKGRTNQDPVYAAIERHRAAVKDYCFNCDRLERADTPKAKGELEALYHAIGAVEAEFVPTTFAGLVALMRYVKVPEKRGYAIPFDMEDAADMIETLAS